MIAQVIRASILHAAFGVDIESATLGCDDGRIVAVVVCHVG